MKRIHISSASVAFTDAERQALIEAVGKLPKGEHTVTTTHGTYTGRMLLTGPNREFKVTAHTKASKSASASAPAKAAPKKAAPKKAAAKKASGRK